MFNYDIYAQAHQNRGFEVDRGKEIRKTFHDANENHIVSSNDRWKNVSGLVLWAGYMERHVHTSIPWRLRIVGRDYECIWSNICK